jgi:hypothetical protein
MVAAYAAMSNEARAGLLEHLSGGTAAEWIATVLTDAGFPVSTSSVRTYRRLLRQQGVLS